MGTAYLMRRGTSSEKLAPDVSLLLSRFPASDEFHDAPGDSALLEGWVESVLSGCQGTLAGTAETLAK